MADHMRWYAPSDPDHPPGFEPMVDFLVETDDVGTTLLAWTRTSDGKDERIDSYFAPKGTQ